MDMRLEVVVLPVSDVDRAKEFYGSLGWCEDADAAAGGSRVVQMTPRGSACSVLFGENLTSAAPGSFKNMHLIVSDIESARGDLVGRGVGVSEIFHCDAGPFCRFDAAGSEGRVSGPAPERRSYSSFATFEDPDGNEWVIQEITTRLPGRIDPMITSFSSSADLADAMRHASAAHGEHEKRIGKPDPNWPDWYADYMVRERAGDALPS